MSTQIQTEQTKRFRSRVRFAAAIVVVLGFVIILIPVWVTVPEGFAPEFRFNCGTAWTAVRQRPQLGVEVAPNVEHRHAVYHCGEAGASRLVLGSVLVVGGVVGGRVVNVRRRQLEESFVDP